MTRIPFRRVDIEVFFGNCPICKEAMYSHGERTDIAPLAGDAGLHFWDPECGVVLVKRPGQDLRVATEGDIANLPMADRVVLGELMRGEEVWEEVPG